MSHRYRIPNRSSLGLNKIRRELKRRTEALLSREEGTLTDSLRDVFSAAGRILARVGRPSFNPEYLATDVDPDPAAWNRNMDQIEEDLATAFDEEVNIRNLSTEVSNTAQMAGKELEEKANLAKSRVADLKMLAGQLDTEVLVAGDDFNDLSKVETGPIGNMSKADVNTVHGIVTLTRLEARNVITTSADIDIQPLRPEGLEAESARLPGGTQEPPGDRDEGTPPVNGRGEYELPEGIGIDPNVQRFYEGRFYAPVAEARPEGGRWHLEEKVRPGVIVAGDSTVFHIQDPQNTNDFFGQFPDLRRPERVVTTTTGGGGSMMDGGPLGGLFGGGGGTTTSTTVSADRLRETGLSLRPEDIIVLDRGAPLAELLGIRRKMIDGDAASFWECEYVRQADELDAMVFGGSVGEGEDTVEYEGDIDITQVTPQDLRDLARSKLDDVDFEVAITISLQRKELVNFITVNPMNFGETTWLEITEVSTASEELDAFQPIEGFDSNLFETVLTDEANAELTEEESAVTLSSNRYSSRGTGVFVFAPRYVTRIRVKFLQRVPVPAQYERTVVQLNRTLTATETYSSGGGGMI